MEAAGLVRTRDCPDVTAAKRLLRRRSRRLPRWLEIRYRHGVSSTDGFTMRAGFASFEPVAEGQILARDNAGEVHTPHGGLLLMPLYQRQGTDGFFIARPVKTMWLWLSQVLRAARADRIGHWLPGVTHDPSKRTAVVVNRHVARWLALQVLHLLGYRKTEVTEGELRMRRR